MEHQYQGTVKFFDKEKGFGFITVQGEGDIFVHVSGLEGYDPERGYAGPYPEPGETVAFDVAEGKKGLNAVNVRINSSQQASAQE